MKILLFTVLMMISLGAYSETIKGLKCSDKHGDYHLGIYKSSSKHYSIYLGWDLDVPGGRWGSRQHKAVGKMNNTKVSLKIIDDEGYDEIEGNSKFLVAFGLEFDCQVVNKP